MSPSERPGQQSEVPGPVTDARQRALIDQAVVAVNDDDRILAAWLGGSYASGEADAYSDVDLHCLVVDDSAGWFTDHWSETAAAIAGPLVLASNLPGVIGGYALTSDWVHLDLIIHPASMLEPTDVEGVKPLYDPTRVVPVQAERSDATRQGDPYFPAAAVDLFFYFLGNLVVTLGRGELIVAHGGIVAVRAGLIDLMLAERGIRRTGGSKRLNPYLDADQRAFLESIPGADVTRDQIAHAVQFIACEFIRRGRALAARTGSIWPMGLEDATITHLQRHLGIDFRAGPVAGS